MLTLEGSSRSSGLIHLLNAGGPKVWGANLLHQASQNPHMEPLTPHDAAIVKACFSPALKQNRGDKYKSMN